jgi:DNA-binding transcriptional regulator GbsR (MarR family)
VEGFTTHDRKAWYDHTNEHTKFIQRQLEAKKRQELDERAQIVKNAMSGWSPNYTQTQIPPQELAEIRALLYEARQHAHTRRGRGRPRNNPIDI